MGLGNTALNPGVLGLGWILITFRGSNKWFSLFKCMLLPATCSGIIDLYSGHEGSRADVLRDTELEFGAAAVVFFMVLALGVCLFWPEGPVIHNNKGIIRRLEEAVLQLLVPLRLFYRVCRIYICRKRISLILEVFTTLFHLISFVPLYIYHNLHMRLIIARVWLTVREIGQLLVPIGTCFYRALRYIYLTFLQLIFRVPMYIYLTLIQLQRVVVSVYRAVLEMRHVLFPVGDMWECGCNSQNPKRSHQVDNHNASSDIVC